MSIRITVKGPAGRVTGEADTATGARARGMAAYKKKHGPWPKGALTFSAPREVNGESRAPKAAAKVPAAPKTARARKANPARVIRELPVDDIKLGARGSVITIESKDGIVNVIKIHRNQRDAEEYTRGRRGGQVIAAKALFYGTG